MSKGDRYERRRQEERDWERRRDEREAREQRRRFEMELASRVTDNPEARQVLFGLEDQRLRNQILGLIPELAVPVDEWELGEDVLTQIKAVGDDPTLLIEDKQHLTLMWLAAGLDKSIQRLESEIAATSVTDAEGVRQLFSRRHALQAKRELVQQQIREQHNQGLDRLKKLMRP